MPYVVVQQEGQTTETRRAASVVAVALAVIGSSFVFGASGVPCEPRVCVAAGSPRFPGILRELRDAERADRMNSTSWSADNPTVDRYYRRKAKEVHLLIDELQGGRAVPLATIHAALDDSEARRFE